MATTPIELAWDPGKTLTIDIYPLGNDTITAVSGRSLTEATNRDGIYGCNITEALSGYYEVHLFEGSIKLAIFDISLADTTTLAHCMAYGSNQIHAIAAANAVLIGMVNSNTSSIKTKTDQLAFGTANRVNAQIYGFQNDTITRNAYDESTAHPLRSADTGSTAVARTGADGDTLETLSDQVDGVSAKTDQMVFTTANRLDSTAVTVSDKTGYSISGTLTTLDALDTAQDTQHSTTQSAISTAQADLDIITGSDGVTVATTQPNYSISTFDSTSDTVDVGKLNGNATAAVVQSYLARAALTLTVDDATFSPTTSAFETDGTLTADDTLIGMAGTWFNSSGSPANVGTYFITDSEGTVTNANSKLKITTETLPAAPADGDIFVVLGAKVKG